MKIPLGIVLATYVVVHVEGFRYSIPYGTEPSSMSPVGNAAQRVVYLTEVSLRLQVVFSRHTQSELKIRFAFHNAGPNV